MQSDEVIWQIINHQFCSFKSKLARERTFCANEYNVTGLCLRSACPLANSSYATIREIDGICYLFIKTAERAHTPKKLWEKIKLPGNYLSALELVSNKLEFFPKYLVHRNKQRLTKIHQMLIRMRKLKLKARPKLVTTSTRTDQVEVIRERKALKAAQLDRAIENELLERLKQVSESEIYNYPEKQYSKALKRAATEVEVEEEFDEDEVVMEEGSRGSYRNARAAASKLAEDEEEEYEDDGEDMVEDHGEDYENLDMDGDYNVEYVEDFEESDNESDIEDVGDIFSSSKSSKPKSKSVSFTPESIGVKSLKRKSEEPTNKGKKSSKLRNKGPRVEIEYEYEDEQELQAERV